MLQAGIAACRRPAIAPAPAPPSIFSYKQLRISLFILYDFLNLIVHGRNAQEGNTTI
jgi:hypothetical protein